MKRNSTRAWPRKSSVSRETGALLSVKRSGNTHVAGVAKKRATAKIPIPTEHQEQVMLCAWLDAHGILYCAVPNGGKRHMLEAKKLKAAGVKPGVPDILIFSLPASYLGVLFSSDSRSPRGVAIEMKRRGRATISAQQMQWRDGLSGCGWVGYFAYGADDAIEWLKKLGYGR